MWQNNDIDRCTYIKYEFDSRQQIIFFLMEIASKGRMIFNLI